MFVIGLAVSIDEFSLIWNFDMGRLNHDMYACGQKGLPETIYCVQQTWHLQHTFKHDFYACTGLYFCRDTNRRCVLKISRVQPFFGIPTAYIGRFLRNRELKILRRLNGLDQIPNFLGTFGRNGLIYEYIEGKSLDERPPLPDNFFSQLEKLLDKIHDRNVCYMDMNKRGNILIGKDGRPYLIDFQISLFLPGRFWSRLRQNFQKADRYHLLKHKRKFRPDLLTEDERKRAKQAGRLIGLHRLIGNPFRKVRRAILRFLYRKNILTPRSHTLSTPENDHRRFLQ